MARDPDRRKEAPNVDTTLIDAGLTQSLLDELLRQRSSPSVVPYWHATHQNRGYIPLTSRGLRRWAARNLRRKPHR